MIWAQETVDATRYVLLEHKYSVAFAEGSTNEPVRTSKPNHINFGFHSDWVLELTVAFESPQSLLSWLPLKRWQILIALGPSIPHDLLGFPSLRQAGHC